MPYLTGVSSLWEIGIIAAGIGFLYAAIMLPVAFRSSLAPYLERVVALVWRRRALPADLSDDSQNDRP